MHCCSSQGFNNNQRDASDVAGRLRRHLYHDYEWKRGSRQIHRFRQPGHTRREPWRQSDLDYVLLDLPPGTGDVAIDVAAMIPQAKEIIVTTPQATASFVATRAGSMALHTKHEILGAYIRL